MARVVRIGVDEMIQDLEGLQGQVIAQVARPALNVGGKAAVEMARTMAPKRTGRFAASIHMGGAGDSTGGEDLGPGEATDSSFSVIVGSTLWYGQYIEYGTPRVAARRPVGNGVDAADQVILDALDHYMAALFGGMGL